MQIEKPPIDIWKAVASAVASSKKPRGRRGSVPGGLWERLAFEIDFENFRPEFASWVEIKEFELAWGNGHIMLANARDLWHFRIPIAMKSVIAKFDGRLTVAEIIVENFEETGELEVETITDLIRDLYRYNFFVVPYQDTYEQIRKSLQGQKRFESRLIEFAKTLTIEWNDAEKLVRWLYDHGVKYFFRRPVITLSAILSVAGLVAFAFLFRLAEFREIHASPREALILIILGYLVTFVHELGHASYLVHHGRRVKSAGFLIYFGSPAFFVESVDGLMLERRQRAMQSFAGPYSQAIIAGLSSILAVILAPSELSHLMYKFSLINYFEMFLNLIPLLQLDGYWILTEIIQVPELRPMSLAFLRYNLFHKLRNRERFNLQEVGLTAYGVVGIAFTIFSLYASFFFWRRLFGSFFIEMWTSGWLTRALLILLVILVAGPLVRGAVALLRVFLRRIRSLLDAVVFKFQTKWRIEAAELIDSSEIFDDLPVDVLNDLAGRVSLQTYRTGQPIVRQGERADAYYVVRIGLLSVVEEPTDGQQERTLRVLRRGDSFGEIGLAESAPRRATVRAEMDTQVFRIDKSSFDMLLADSLRAPTFAPTAQQIGELRSIGPFGNLEPNQVLALMKHGSWVTFPPGHTVMKQGDQADAFYAVQSGQLEVIRSRKKVASLGPGDYFGEIALILDVPRTATVRTKTPVRAFRLDRQGFGRLVRRSLVRPRIASRVEVRLWEH